MKNKWTKPKLKHYPLESGKEWYVWFRFNGGNPIRRKEDLNKIDNYNERLAYGNALAEVIEERLIKGWIPTPVKTTIRNSLNLIESLEFALEKKRSSLSSKSYNDYNSVVSFFIKTAKKLKFDKIPISSCERFHVKSIMDDLQIERKWRAKHYNKNLGILKSIFSELVEWEHIPYNPVRDIRNQKEIKTEGYAQLTDSEHQTVFSHLKKIDYNFYIFCSFAYYLGIRPKELLSVKCKSVNIEHQTITVEVGTSKNRKMRIVPLIGTTLELLENFDISNSDFYLFGTYLKTGGRPNLKNYLCPNPYMIKRDTVTKLWHKCIILGLGINKHLYSLKHKGANDKMKAGIDLKTISSIFGHSSEKITEIYATHINNLRFEEAKKVKLNEY